MTNVLLTKLRYLTGMSWGEGPGPPLEMQSLWSPHSGWTRPFKPPVRSSEYRPVHGSQARRLHLQHAPRRRCAGHCYRTRATPAMLHPSSASSWGHCHVCVVPATIARRPQVNPGVGFLHPTLLLRQGLSLSLETTNSAGLAVQQAQRPLVFGSPVLGL